MVLSSVKERDLNSWDDSLEAQSFSKMLMSDCCVLVSDISVGTGTLEMSPTVKFNVGEIKLVRYENEFEFNKPTYETGLFGNMDIPALSNAYPGGRALAQKPLEVILLQVTEGWKYSAALSCRKPANCSISRIATLS